MTVNIDELQTVSFAIARGKIKISISSYPVDYQLITKCVPLVAFWWMGALYRMITVLLVSMNRAGTTNAFYDLLADILSRCS